MAKIFYKLLISLLLTGAVAGEKLSDIQQSTKSMQVFLNKHCIECHDEDVQKGKVRLDDFLTLNIQARDEMLNKVEEQVYLRMMPPKKKKQPTGLERNQLLNDIKVQFGSIGLSSKLAEKLKKLKYANYVDHNQLFSGEYTNLKGFTYDRNWLISEQIFNEKINRIIDSNPTRKVNGKHMSVLGFSNQTLGLTNPFLLPDHSGVRYYANDSLNRGHLLTMLSNARILGGHLTTENQLKTNLKPVYRILQEEFTHNNIIAKRRSFLNSNMAAVLQKIYGTQNKAYLPVFKPLKLNFVKYDGSKKGKVDLHWAWPSKNVKKVASEKVNRYMKVAKSDEKIIEMCERDWFQEGVSPVILSTWLVFLHNYVPEIKKSVAGKKFKKKPYRPLDSSEMAIIGKSIKRHRVKGDNYSQIINKCVAEWQHGFAVQRARKGLPNKVDITTMVKFLFSYILEENPDKQETDEYVNLTYEYIKELGRVEASKQLIETLFVKSEFSYRNELGIGRPDNYGRRKMSPRSLSYALSYAITDSSPDQILLKAASTGQLVTKEDIRREVKRMLAIQNKLYVIDERQGEGKGPNSFYNTYTNTPIRKLRFFREFFGYQNFLTIFKDEKRFGGVYDWAKLRLLDECDRLVDHIVRKDRNVFEELLSTQNFYVYHNGNNAEMKKKNDRIKQRTSAGKKQPHLIGLKHPMVVKFFNIDLADWDYPSSQPAKVPNRMGILTHPAWLIAHSQNTETDPVIRGKFIREKLLAGTIPAVPITVEAVVPEDHHKTLRQRHVEVTEAKACWGCHKKMNPLGYPFEIYDDFGRFRTKEAIEHPKNLIKKVRGIGGNSRMHNRGDAYFDYRNIYKTLPVDAKGFLDGTGEKGIDGSVRDALDMISRLSKSTRVRQSIIRHAFRYFMGRNEMLSDSKTLIDADEAYVKSGGSFDAVIISLLTSDSFIYRKENEE
jgi:hypothetical protein